MWCVGCVWCVGYVSGNVEVVGVVCRVCVR